MHAAVCVQPTQLAAAVVCAANGVRCTATQLGGLWAVAVVVWKEQKTDTFGKCMHMY